MNSKVEFVVSEDGSHTLYVPALDEHYHSVHGAINESMHVYIRTGLQVIEKADISILEVGFGTGLNALLTLAHSDTCRIRYQTFEKYPLSCDVWQQLNYKIDGGDALNSSFKRMHECKWETWQNITNNFEIYKSAIDFRDATPCTGVDLVYFDAFAPDKQLDLWNAEVFSKIFAAMNSGGVLVTYCAKGIVRRMLQEVGFKVERLPGPPPKKEMLRAQKP